jgi:hypothetical protein
VTSDARAGEPAASALLLAGAALLVVPARRYRLDAITCASWPPAVESWLYAGVFALAIALLGLGWWRHPAVSLRRTWALGLAVHAIALLAPPFLSTDSLFYAAIGRALAWYGATGRTPLDQALPAGDALLQLLPPASRAGQSAYFPGFDQLARAIALVAGNRLWLALELHKLVSLAAIALSAFIASRAVEPASRARTVALVLLCPLGIVEATVEAHADALLVPGMALFVLAVRRSRPVASLAALGTGLLIKANALLPIAIRGIDLALRRVRRRWLEPAVWVPVAVVSSVACVLAIAVAQKLPELRRFTMTLLESPDVPFDHCTRSIECLPRVILRFVLNAPSASWAVGVGFRLVGAVWIGYAGLRAARDCVGDDASSLRWMATGLFIYYVFLHGWAQTWYLLPLLPLLAHADPALLPAMRLYCVTGVAYYALVLPTNCMFGHTEKALSDFAEAAVTLLPPAYLIIVTRRRFSLAPPRGGL